MTAAVKSAPSIHDAVFSERLGTTVRGKWKLESLRGVGAMAAVYEASREDGERAALKILHASFAHDKDACDRFLREGVVAGKISHPAAVRIVEDDRTDEGEPFLVMELLQGETVLDAWRKVGRQMAIIPALQIAERVIDCLAVCHEVGVIHRDLKPANLFVTDASEIKVLDFGVAQMRDEGEPPSTKEGRSAVGTPAYMSPEQAMGRDVDGRTDLFSVGAILHSLITGHRIHAAKTEAESLVLAASRPVPSVKTIAPNLPAEVARLIDRALAWDRQSRFADAAQMQEAALEALASQGGEPLAEKGGKSRGMVFDLGGAPTRAPLSMSFGERHPPSGRSAPVRAFFLNVDLALAAAHSHGFDSAQVASSLRLAIDAFSAGTSSLHELDESGESRSLRDPKGRSFTVDVLPYGFVSEGVLVWEPNASMVPHRLFESGVRNLIFQKGLTLEELREFLVIATKEPGRDLPPDDDLRSALWERGLSHVVVVAPAQLAHGVLAERDRFHAAVAGELELVRSSVIERADAIDDGALDPMPGLLLDQETREAAARELALGTEEWTLRYLDAAAFGYAQAASAREEALLLGSLRESARSLLWSKRLVTVIGVYHGMSVRLGDLARGERSIPLLRGLAEALFGGENLALVVRQAGKSVATGKLLAAPLALLGTSLALEAEKVEAAAMVVPVAEPVAEPAATEPAPDAEPAESTPDAEPAATEEPAAPVEEPAPAEEAPPADKTDDARPESSP